MSTALGCGLLAWFADARRNVFWATAMQATEKTQQKRAYRLRDKWLAVKNVSVSILGIAFVVGILLSVAYIVFRVWSI